MDFSSIIGGILGSVAGIFQGFLQKRQNDRQYKLAKQQFALAQQTAQEEEQARNKANQKQVDIEGLLEQNTSTDTGTILSGNKGADRVKNPLNKKNDLLGGSNGLAI